MKLLTRSNLAGVLFGAIAVAMAVWGKYKSWYWYDNLAHVTSGISLGFLASAENSRASQDVLIVLAFNILWELHEYREDVYPWDGSVSSEVAAEDTMLDTMLVLGGAFLAAKASKERQ